MKLAFLISTHTDVTQLKRLIEALPNNSVFFIHVDKKADLKPFTDAFIGDDRVVFIKHRVDVKWGSINEVEYQMELVRAAFDSKEKYDRLITMSGMDYPLWNKERIVQFFEQDTQTEYLTAIDVSTPSKLSEIYREYFFLVSKPGHWRYPINCFIRKALRLLGVRKPLKCKIADKTWKLYKGAAWWAITPQLAKDILYEWDNNKELSKWLRYCMCSAELFAQTVAMNSEKWSERCLFYASGHDSLPKHTPLTYITWKNKEIKVLDIDDLDTLKSNDKMFCRKVITGKSDTLVNAIDRINKKG